MCIGQKIDDAETVNFNNFAIKNRNSKNTLDRNMNFHTHIKIFVEKQVKTKRSVKNQSLPRSKKESFIIQVYNDKISVYLPSISSGVLFKAIK